MLKIRGSIDYDADLMDALRILCNNRITVLPVYKDGKLAGVLRDSDLFLAIAEILEQ
jgi:CBS domain-containing protein